MRTAAFILFAVVTAAAAALSTLVATRYLSLEKELSDTRAQLEQVQHERTRQEEEKMALRLEREHVQADLEARFAEQRSQLEECSNQHQQEFQELQATLSILQKRLTDIQVQAAPSAATEQAAPMVPGEIAAPKEAQPAPTGNSQENPEPQAGSPSPDQPSGKPAADAAKAHISQPDGARKSAKSTDIPKGAIPTPEQEARKLQKAGDAGQ